MSSYSVEVDGFRLTWAAKFGYIALGFLLGIPGVLVCWAIGHRKRMMECSAEAIWLGIIGWAIRNAIKRKTNVTPESDAFGQAFFKTIIAVAPLTKFPPTNWLIKTVAMLGGPHNTRGHSVPLYLDSKGANPAGRTIELLDEAAEAAEGVSPKPGNPKTKR